MFRILAILAAFLVFASAQEIKTKNLLKVTVDDVSQFFNGFLLGLEGNVKTQGPCYNALTATNEDFVAIISDVVRFLNGDDSALEQLLVDSKALYPLLAPLETQCKWGLLVNQTKALIAGGYSTIILRYSLHLKAMTQDILTVKNCKANYTACGRAAGEIVRIELS